MEPDTRAIKTQVEIELHSKRLCSYEHYECSHLAADGSKFCLKHILNDKNAPFKQCNFTYQNNGKRCHLPAPKGDKKDYSYCNEHALKSTLSKNKQNSKNPPPLSAEYLLTNLSHYVRKPRNKFASTGLADEERNNDDTEPKTIRPIDPFVDIDANAIYNEQCNEVLDMCSESESDVEPSTYATVWHDANADSSDNESIDSEDEDPLKHANVYTAEEISLLTRDKLVRLQSLYIEEYKHLRYLLRERRRKYIHSLKREKETCCNIYNQVRDNPKEQRLYKKLKQYNKYHKAYGEEAILDKKLHDLRAKISEGVPFKSSNFTRCQYTEGGVKCAERAIPMAKHCRKHILEDPNQVLFKACGKINADVECSTPVEAIFDDSTCKLHMDIPPLRSYSQPRRDSESDPDDTLDLPPHYAMPTNDNVKAEMIDYSLPALSKMETLPSILFEDSAESLTSTLQYSTSEFTESFDVTESSVTGEVEKTITYESNNQSNPHLLTEAVKEVVKPNTEVFSNPSNTESKSDVNPHSKDNEINESKQDTSEISSQTDAEHRKEVNVEKTINSSVVELNTEIENKAEFKLENQINGFEQVAKNFDISKDKSQLKPNFEKMEID